ncbi:MAG: hypothetical protein JWM11_4890 [Planctomycetaceae bacterium]|nr:hypothetical protein [Planctomycetaceae bacterium]
MSAHYLIVFAFTTPLCISEFRSGASRLPFPNGDASIAQGCRVAATLGKEFLEFTTPTGVAPVESECPQGATPLGLNGILSDLPRVAAARGNPGLLTHPLRGRAKNSHFTVTDFGRSDAFFICIFSPAQSRPPITAQILIYCCSEKTES